MKKTALLATVLSLLSVSSLPAVHATTSRTQNYLAPIGRVVLNPQNEDGTFAFSFLGEAGVRNFRINGTGGTWTTERSRFKLGGEFLDQELSWHTGAGKTRSWVQQGSLAGSWQYLVDGDAFKAYELKAFYTYSPTKHVTDNWRQIAGARNYGGAFGTTFAFNDTSTLDLSVIYDHVRYRPHQRNNLLVAGFGGSLVFTARLPGCVDMALQADFRRPFNYYGIKFSYPKGFDQSVSSAIFAGYTRGKMGLPNALAVGFEMSFKLGGSNSSSAPLWDPCSLASWVETPAIYSPEVLAIIK